MIGAVIAYVLSDFGDWPRLTYWPVRGQWSLESGHHSEAIRYWGGILWALGGAAIGLLIGLTLQQLARRIFKGSSEQSNLSNPLIVNMITLVGAWSIGALGLGVVYFIWMLWPW
jgi:hypothetical protein